jgi:integrase
VATAASLVGDPPPSRGVPARVVIELLGHAQIPLTLGTYSHVVPELKRTAADRMGAALWG